MLPRKTRESREIVKDITIVVQQLFRLTSGKPYFSFRGPSGTAVFWSTQTHLTFLRKSGVTLPWDALSFFVVRGLQRTSSIYMYMLSYVIIHYATLSHMIAYYLILSYGILWNPTWVNTFPQTNKYVFSSFGNFRRLIACSLSLYIIRMRLTWEIVNLIPVAPSAKRTFFRVRCSSWWLNFIGILWDFWLMAQNPPPPSVWQISCHANLGDGPPSVTVTVVCYTNISHVHLLDSPGWGLPDCPRRFFSARMTFLIFCDMYWLWWGLPGCRRRFCLAQIDVPDTFSHVLAMESSSRLP